MFDGLSDTTRVLVRKRATVPFVGRSDTRKSDAAAPMLQVVYGAVYVPDVPDTHNDFMVADEIRKAAWAFLASGETKKVDLNHNNKLTGAYVVESFIVREGDPDFKIPGTWVIGVHIPDVDLWDAVLKGEINGFSMEALVETRDGSIEVPAFPASIVGKTETCDGHEHTFEAVFDKNGKLVGGKTSTVKDSQGRLHFHEIERSSVTTESAHGAHRFFSIDLVQELPRG